MYIIAVLLTVLGGLALSSQAQINGSLGGRVGVIEASFISFLTGACLLTVLVLFFGQGNILAIFDVPKWQLSAVFCGVSYVLFSIFAVPRIGVIATSIIVISGQLSMGLIIDHFGWFHGMIIPLDAKRLLALLFMVISLFFIYKGNKRALEERKPEV